MVIFPSAVIRGALMNLGIQSIVSVEIAIPQCTFQIRTAITTPNPNTPPGNPPNPVKQN
ncbi:Trafficking protein particle complex subunit 33 [Puccinia graminis f. sp. tritici]|nr:Trafficking protein particle complex subunit 33 [Puccinia graminis f. sp. tritici]